jgi:hypothetical protein
LFSLTATVAGTEPQIVITAPGGGLTVSAGDSVLVLAEVTGQEGLSTIVLSGEYADSVGGEAYIPAIVQGAGAAFVRVNRYIQPATAQVLGDVYVRVVATDAAGAVGRDSVKIAIVSN